MADNKKFNTYVSSNSTTLNFRAGAKQDMTEEHQCAGTSSCEICQRG